MASNKGDESSSSNPKSLRRVFARFSEKTSMVGPGYIYSATRISAKIAWTFFMIGALVVMSLHLYLLINDFLQFPKKTSIEIGFSNLLLPAVTVCNVNPFRKSLKSRVSKNMTEFLEIVDPTNYGWAEKNRPDDDFDNVDLSYFYENDYEEEYYQDDDSYVPPRDVFTHKQTVFEELFMSESRSNRKDVGHQIEHMLLNCAFRGRKCYASNFTSFQTPQYGNCYTLSDDKMKVKSTGPKSGLTLVLYLQTGEYLDGITEGYGVRIQIHNANEIPFPYESGIFLPAGYETNIALRLKNITRVKKPHGVCNTDENFIKLYKKAYTLQSCENLCKTTKTAEKCNCYDEEDSDLFLNNTDLKPCQTKEEKLCKVRTFDAVIEKRLTCSCTQPCFEMDYTYRISGRDWPTEKYSGLLAEMVCDEQQENCDEILKLSSSSMGFSKSFLKVSIYYEALNFEKITEEPEIQESQFASDVGGAIGLWIGLSMLSLIEIFQLLGEIIEYFTRKLCSNQRNTRKMDDFETNHGKNNTMYELNDNVDKRYDKYYSSIGNSDRRHNQLNDIRYHQYDGLDGRENIYYSSSEYPGYSVYTGKNK